MKKNFYILISIVMALLVGILIGICIGINLKTTNFNLGDTYKYYDQPVEELPKTWNI